MCGINVLFFVVSCRLLAIIESICEFLCLLDFLFLFLDLVVVLFVAFVGRGGLALNVAYPMPRGWVV